MLPRIYHTAMGTGPASPYLQTRYRMSNVRRLSPRALHLPLPLPLPCPLPRLAKVALNLIRPKGPIY